MFKITPIIVDISPTFQYPMSILSIMVEKYSVYKIFFHEEVGHQSTFYGFLQDNYNLK